MYWDSVWNKEDIDRYEQYIQNYKGVQNSMTKILFENSCKNICDAACGFGANSMVLLSNGFNVYGFDISEDSVWITCKLLRKYGLIEEQYKVASLLETGYKDALFDAVTIRAALDHLSVFEFEKALIEMKRIVKKRGLLYASFDSLEKEDMEAEHLVTEDGSFLYLSGEREGLIFHYYSDEKIKQAFSEFEMILFETDQRGSRHIIVRMP